MSHAKSGHFQWKGRLCFYCGEAATGFDHKIPTARGGRGDHENLTPACHGCNSRKGQFTIEEFRLMEAIRTQRMPLAFHGEPSPPAARDFIMVVSKGFASGMAVHNGKRRAA